MRPRLAPGSLKERIAYEWGDLHLGLNLFGGLTRGDDQAPGRGAWRDALAGIVLSSMNIPQVLGYTRIAGTPVVTGLYTVFLPLIAFAVFGSSRHLVVAADSATASIFASGLAGMAEPGSPHYMDLVAIVALLTAGLLLVARIFRLGFLADFLSRTVLVGFLTGVGFQVGIAMLGGMFGVQVDSPHTLDQIRQLLESLPQTQLPTLSLALFTVMAILVSRALLPRLPMALVLVVGSICASHLFDFKGLGIAILGPVPGGIPGLFLPSVSPREILALIPIAISCFVIIVAQSAVTAGGFALRHHERVDEDADILGLSAANAAAALSGAFVVNGSPTQTAMAERAGASTQLAQLVFAAVVALVLLFLTGPLAYLPHAVLDGIVFTIAVGLVDFRGLWAIGRESPGELKLALITAATVTLVGVGQGILLAVVLSLLRHVRNSYHPHTAVLAPDRAGRWLPIPARAGVESKPGLLVYRFGADLFYANERGFGDEVRLLLAQAPTPVRCLVIEAGAINDLDYSAAGALRDLCDELKGRGIGLIFGRVEPSLRADMERHGILALVGPERALSTLHEALALARWESSAQPVAEHATTGSRPASDPPVPELASDRQPQPEPQTGDRRLNDSPGDPSHHDPQFQETAMSEQPSAIKSDLKEGGVPSPGPDLEKVPVDQVFATLGVKPEQGLSTAEAEQRLTQYGPNAIVEKEQGFLSKLLGHFTGPIAFMIEAAALVSAIIGHWDDFAIIAALLLFNVALEMWQDRKASNALAALKKGLAPEAVAKRDGTWQTVQAATLVPGDLVKIRLGVIVPADLRMVQGDYASIDQAALTGESLPVAKKIGDAAYSGSVVKQGEMEGLVIATGANTFFGRTAKLVAGAGSVSHAQKAMFQIGNFLIILALVLAAIMVAVQVYRDIVVVDNWGLKDGLAILQFVLVLLVASIPVAMPTVFSVTMALGALALSKEKAIVSKLSAIEEMAGVDILCSDKTGTLTKNQLTLGDPILLADTDPQDCILAAALASRIEDRDAIDTAVIAALKDPGAMKSWTLTKFTPFDPVTKRTEATLTDGTGQTLSVAKGAPQAILDLAKPAAEVAGKVQQTVSDLAAKGSRALGVARCTDGGNWSLLGILPMFDPPRDDSKATIDKANEKGVRVKMVTGDDTAIAVETARQLGLGTHIIPAADAFPKDMDPNQVPSDIVDAIERADGFARVFPEHKYAIVKALQSRGHLVAMTGDGVNDAPALKQADCGTAVSGATDAARGAAALILTAPGLSVINSAIDEARRIFGRITSYTIYRVALTMDIMFLVVLSSIFLGFQPLTAVMIVVMSLLDDVPIMAIAYDNTRVSEQPIRWEMPRLLGISAVLGFFSIVQSFGLLLIGVEALHHSQHAEFLGLAGQGQLQTVMFLQLVAGGHLLLFITRTERWFFMPPLPAAPLFWAILMTQIVAVLMCAFGLLVPQIPWKLIGMVWAYNLVWMVLMGAVRLATERFATYRTARHQRSIRLMSA